MQDFSIENLIFDEPFKTGTGYEDYITGESSPANGCAGDLLGKVDIAISASVQGTAMTSSDFSTPNPSTVSLSFSAPADPLSPPAYSSHPSKAFPASSLVVYASFSSPSASACVLSCHSDLLCDCTAYDSSMSQCTKARGGCEASGLTVAGTSAVYVRPRDATEGGEGGGGGGGEEDVHA